MQAKKQHTLTKTVGWASWPLRLPMSACRPTPSALSSPDAACVHQKMPHRERSIGCLGDAPNRRRSPPRMPPACTNSYPIEKELRLAMGLHLIVGTLLPECRLHAPTDTRTPLKKALHHVSGAVYNYLADQWRQHFPPLMLPACTNRCTYPKETAL